MTSLAGQPVIVELVRARNVVKADMFSESDPYCVCSIRHGDQTTSRLVTDSIEHKWPTVDDEPNPGWFTTVWLAKEAPAGSFFHLKLFDYDSTSKDDLLGYITVPVEKLVIGKLITLTLPYVEDKKKLQEVDVIFKEIPKETKKRIIIIRHGESEWNEAQSNTNLKKMVSRVDHPLTNAGASQALGLACKVAEAIKNRGNSSRKDHPNHKLPREVNDLLDTEVVYVSPLCRAVQTALLGLHPIGARPSWELKRNAREKRNFGGRDSSGTTFGKDLLPFYVKEIMELHDNYNTAVKNAASPTTPAGGRVIDKNDPTSPTSFSIHPFPHPEQLAQMLEKIDKKEADTKWWTDEREGTDDSSRRISDLFFQQCMFDPRPVIVIVGHSHFFRDTFVHYMSNELRDKIKNKTEGADLGYTLEQWFNYKLENCGAAHVEFDYSAIFASWRQGRPAGGEDLKCIEKVSLLFGTKLVP